MKPKTLKFLVAGLLVSLLLVGTLAFFIKKKLNPAYIKKELVEYVENNYPAIRLSFEKLDLNLGFNSEVILKKLLLTQKSTNKEMLIVEIATIKIPLLNMILGGGTIDLIVNKPTLNYMTIGGNNNWLTSFEKKKDEATKSTAKESKLPALLLNSQVNAEFRNFDVRVFEENELVNTFTFDLLQLKDIGIKRPMAIKLSSKIEFKKEKKISFNLNTIGEFNLKSLIQDKVTNIKALSKVSNIFVDGKVLLEEEISSDANIFFRKDNTGKVTLSISSEGIIDSEVEALFLKNETKIDFKKARLSIDFIKRKYFSDLLGFSSNDSWVELSGNLTQEKEGRLIPELSMIISKPMTYALKGNAFEIERVLLKQFNTDFNLNVNARYLKGSLGLSLGNEIDINKQLDISKLGVFSASLIINGMEVNKEILSFEKSPRKDEIKKERAPFVLPMNLSLEFKNILLVKEVISGSGEVNLVKDKLSLKGFKLKHGEGEVHLDTTTQGFIGESKHKFSIETKNMNLSFFDSFLEKETPRLTGILNTSIVGKANMKAQVLSYDAFVKGSAIKGELKGYDASTLINSYLDKVNQLPYFKKKPLKQVKVPQNYEKASFDLHVKSDEIKIKKANLTGVDGKIRVDSKGTVRTKGASEVFLNITDRERKYLKFLKEVDMRSLPLRMAGPGYELKADYDYTLKFVRKKAEKRIKKKVKKAAKKAVKKELKKLKEKVLKGKEPKDLIKDLFQ